MLFQEHLIKLVSEPRFSTASFAVVIMIEQPFTWYAQYRLLPFIVNLVRLTAFIQRVQHTPASPQPASPQPPSPGSWKLDTDQDVPLTPTFIK